MSGVARLITITRQGLSFGQIHGAPPLPAACPRGADSMNFEPTDDQKMIVDTFPRFLDENSTTAKVRSALTAESGPSGFDPALWRGFAELGGFGIRVPEDAGGLGLGLFDAVLVMQELGRTLASGPFAEAIVA